MMNYNYNRVEAFRSCLLNTCVRVMRTAFEGLTLSNCMDSEEFRAAAGAALQLPLFSNPVEPAMQEARLELLYELMR